MKNRKTTPKIATDEKPPAGKQRSPDEQRIIGLMEHSKGRKLTAAEEEWCLSQAREIGEL